MVVKVVFDAGHGLNTPGKRSPAGEREWLFNNKVVLASIKYLNQYEGVSILRVDDPTGKIDVPLATRTSKANNWGADIYISCHHNANTGEWGDWTGTETYYFEGSTKGKKLAQLIHAKVLKAYGLRDRGIKRGNHLYVIKNTKMPAVLVEGGFMDSTIDIQKLRDDKVLEAAGKAIAKGIAEYFGLKKKTSSQSKSPFRFRYWNGSVIRNGERGEHVKELQRRLLALGYKLPKYGADGVMGSETANAVRQFQRDAGIGVDGVPGPQTKIAMER